MHPWSDHAYRLAQLPKFPKQQNRLDRELLLREAGAINAEVDWDNGVQGLTITVTAPNGLVWVSNQERQLIQTTAKSDGSWIREAVADLLDHMNQGLTGEEHERHEDSCECDECEEHHEDLEELSF